LADSPENIGRLAQRIDMLDQRLDNIDSMVTAVIERIMVQPITMTVVCPHCGKNIELGFIGSEKKK
jgi:hypothetical protein